MNKSGILGLALVVLIGLPHCAEKDDSFFWLLAMKAGLEGESGGPAGEEGSGSGGETSEESGASGESGAVAGSSEESGDVTGEGEFTFNTVKNIDLDVTVLDAATGALPGAVVQILLLNGESIYQAATGADGKTLGVFTIGAGVSEVILKVISGDRIHTSSVLTADLLKLVRVITLEGAATGSGPDSDGDGIPDAEDAYPDDDSRAAEIEHPSSGVSIIAYEDLYPKKGDADFNDYVVRLSNEEDLDSSGKTVRVRGSYQHIARGAGYKHTLKISLADVPATVIRRIYSASGTLESETTTLVTSARNLEILGDSSTTISQSNTSSSQTYAPGKKAELEVIFDQPVSRADLRSFPYDLFISVHNTGHEIHFPAIAKKADGTDQYLDSDGFPWAIQIPEAWDWPLEGKKIWDGYPDFTAWYESNGTNHPAWYQNPVSNFLFSFVSQSGLGAAIWKGYGGPLMLIGLAVFGGLMFLTLTLRKRLRAR
ncbi:MAG: LruC domain-containing protein [Spirochaetales bacterium]|nr:LruC domain-containing protein [Spirochaetales bacterium]